MRTVLAILFGTGILVLSSCSRPQHATTPTKSGDAASTTAEPSAVGLHPEAKLNSRAKAHVDVPQGITIGEMAPDFEMTIDDKTWKLSELQKNQEVSSEGVIVLTFWCSFCHSCRDVERPLDKLAKQYKGKVGVIAVDASVGETTTGVAEFAAKNGLTFPIALSADGSAADAFGVRVTTTTVIIDQEGVVRYCGQFSDPDHHFAEDALNAVLAGEEVPVKKTRHKG